MKKLLFAFVILVSVSANSSYAQMNEMIGVVGVNGVMSNNAYKNVGQMQKSLSHVQLQQDVTLLVNEIQTTYMHDYSSIDPSLLSFRGFRGIKWDVQPVSSSEFYISLENVDASSCFIIKNNPWNANHVDINNGQDCQSLANSVKLYF